MDKVNGKLTVFFEEPFWVGIFERIEDGKLSVAKVTFGAEPKDYEVQEYILFRFRTKFFFPESGGIFFKLFFERDVLRIQDIKIVIHLVIFLG